LRDIDCALGRHLLEDELHRKQGLEIARTNGLLGAGMQNRRQRFGQIGNEIVPALGNVIFVQDVLGLLTHATLPRLHPTIKLSEPIGSKSSFLRPQRLGCACASALSMSSACLTETWRTCARPI